MRYPFLVLLAGLVVPLAACGRGDIDGAAAAPPTVVIGPEDFVVAQVDTIRTGPALSGSLEAERQADIRAELSSMVTATLVEPGERVEAGQVMVRLQDGPVRAAWLGARTAVRTAQTALEQARRDLERDQRLQEAGAISSRQAEISARATDRAEANLADAEARLVAAERDLGRAEIRAPFSGIVSARPVRTGDVVQPGAPLVTVVDPGSMELRAQVPAAAIRELRLGTTATFTVAGYADRQFQGTVTRINPAVDPVTRQVPVVVKIPNRGNELVAGLFAEGHVATEVRVGVTVPSRAVDRQGLRPRVYRLNSGQVEPVEIELGLEDRARERVEILGSIHAGDTLLTGSSRDVPEGATVRVRAAAEAPAADTTGRAGT